jgi:hypothetical protein
MNGLIKNLGIAVITFILGLFALDLWNTLNPPKLVQPKQMLISESQYKEVLRRATERAKIRVSCCFCSEEQRNNYEKFLDSLLPD